MEIEDQNELNFLDVLVIKKWIYKEKYPKCKSTTKEDT